MQLESCEWIYSYNRTYEGKWDHRETEILVHPVESLENGQEIAARGLSSVFERSGLKFSLF